MVYAGALSTWEVEAGGHRVQNKSKFPVIPKNSEKKNLDDCKKYIDLDNFQQSDHHVVFL